MPPRINPTLFDKLAGDLSLEGVREAADTSADVSLSSLRYYSVPALERFNETALRATVLRELNWLLNTTSLESSVDLALYPEVESSVLNYGVRDMAGKLSQRPTIEARARDIHQAITRFEPRVDRSQLDVEPSPSAERPNAVTFTIRGDLTAAVNALPIELKTDVEIDTGAATLRD